MRTFEGSLKRGASCGSQALSMLVVFPRPVTPVRLRLTAWRGGEINVTAAAPAAPQRQRRGAAARKRGQQAWQRREQRESKACQRACYVSIDGHHHRALARVGPLWTKRAPLWVPFALSCRAPAGRAGVPPAGRGRRAGRGSPAARRVCARARARAPPRATWTAPRRPRAPSAPRGRPPRGRCPWCGRAYCPLPVSPPSVFFAATYIFYIFFNMRRLPAGVEVYLYWK